MSNSPNSFSARCSSCGKRNSVTLDELTQAVRSMGHLRRSAEPSAELVLELCRDTPLNITCWSCGATGLSLGNSSNEAAIDDEDEFDGWPDEASPRLKRCEQCGEAIDPDRLEIFPDSKFCTGCQRKDEQGALNSDAGFCEFCGGRVQVSGRGGSGLAGYRLTCQDCGRKQ